MDAQPTRYRLYVVKASEIVWETRNTGQRNPNTFVEICLGGKPIHTTTTKKQTRAPLWDERVELESDDPTSMLTLNLRHCSATGEILSIGSKKLTIQAMEEIAIFNPNASLDLYDNHTKTGVVAVRFTKEKLLGAVEQETEECIPAYIPPELRPDFGPLKHPSDDEKEIQIIGYYEENPSMDQARRIVRQILARSSAANSNADNV